MARFIPAAVIAAALTAAAPAAGQGYDYDSAMRELESSNRRLQSMEQQVINQAMNDPRVRTDYRRYLERGGRAGFREYATWHAYTAGGTRPFQPQSPGQPSMMDQSVYDGRVAAITGGRISRPDHNGQCWIVGGTSNGSPAACPR